MRVTANSVTDMLLNEYHSLNARQNMLQTQAATGQRIQFPEDDPSVVRRVLELQTESTSNSQYQRNISRMQEMANVSFSAMKSLKTVADRAGELITRAGGITSSGELADYASELNEMIKQAVQAANTQDQGNYIFSGTNASTPPFVMTTNSAGLVTGVTYQGNASVASNEISEGVSVSVQTLGANTTGTGPRGLISDPRTGTDFFSHLISLRNNLLAGNKTAITTTDQAAIAKDEDNLLFHFTTNGAVQARLEATSKILSSRNLELDKLVSKDVDADLAETLTHLSQTQNAYKAALQSGATMLNMSLMDYLR